jgi:glycerol-3-phosphate dehydrogenase
VPPRNAAAGHPKREGLHVVVAAVVAVGTVALVHGCAAEFATPNHQRVVTGTTGKRLRDQPHQKTRKQAQTRQPQNQLSSNSNNRFEIRISHLASVSLQSFYRWLLRPHDGENPL